MQIISVYSLLPLIGSVLVFVLGFFVWLKKPTAWIHILFWLYDFTIAIWLFGTFMLFNATNAIDQLYWDRFIYAGVVFIPIFLYHFGLIYCDLLKRQKVFLVIGYLVAFVFLPVTQLSDKFVSGLYRYSWGVHSVAHVYHHYFLAYFFFYFILFFINLGIHYRHSSGARKKEVRYILIGYGILDLIGPLAFLPAYGVPVYPVVFLSALPFAGLLSYAIIRYQALDVRTITAEVVITSLNIVLFAEIFFSQTNLEIILRSLVEVLVFLFSVMLIRSVKKEIRRREEVTTMANSLEQANLRLQELDKQKTDFLSIAAHQLRTPLSIIKGYVELIHDGAYGKVGEKVKEILGNMDESNGRLVKLVDEFLDITRIEQGRVKFTFKEGDVCQVIKSVIDELRDRAEQSGHKLSGGLGRQEFLAFMDDEKIRHFIFNFVDNAIKYSQRGEIKVAVAKDGVGVSVKVSDHGYGFGKKDEASFFQKFYRGENVKNVDVTGTGLGLYVCRKFIEAHQGKIWAHSAGLGKGSEFGFWIPNVSK